MRKQLFLSAVVWLAAANAVVADDTPKAVVDGQQRSGIVANITFDADQLQLNYTDGTIETVDMESVVITFSETTAVKVLQKAGAKGDMQYFDLRGKQLRRAPQKGSYLMKKGGKVVKVIKK